LLCASRVHWRLLALGIDTELVLNMRISALTAERRKCPDTMGHGVQFEAMFGWGGFERPGRKDVEDV
jgi:hypothetical protein